MWASPLCSRGLNCLFHAVPAVNPVERRILELASFQLGPRKKYVRSVRRKVVIPNQRYSWLLFEHPEDTEHVESVVLDVNLAEALEIDRSVAETFKGGTLFLGVLEQSPRSLHAQ